MKLLTTIIFLCFALSAISQDKTEKEFEALTSNIANNSLVDIALKLVGKPYKAETLEINSTESLVVNLHEFDCVTFVETAIALYLSAQQENLNIDIFKKHLTNIRYRKGKINGYLSRLHYSLDWVSDNIENEILEDVSKNIGGENIAFNLNFMSKNYDKYPYLKANPELVVEIKQTEQNLNKGTYYYIPKAKINSLKNKIHNGDVIFFVTSIAGLDISHVGIAYKENEVNTFIHASQKMGKVIVNPESLYDYCMNIKSNLGIIVCRIK